MRSIPVHILTGFLGAGKSTLLNRALRSAELAKTAVIVNELGDIGIDHLWVETGKDSPIDLSGGCFCCTMNGDLALALDRLDKMIHAGPDSDIQRVIIETSGIAEPVPILNAIANSGGRGSVFRAGIVVAVVDAANGLATLRDFPEAVRQIESADKIIISKTDIAGDHPKARLKERLALCNSRAPIFAEISENDDPGFLFLGEGLASGSEPEAALTAQDHRHSPVNAVSVRHAEPLQTHIIDMFCDLLLSNLGERIIRIKGIVETVEEPERPLLVQAAGIVLHPPARLNAWPDAVRGTRLVVIGSKLDAGYIERTFAAFTGGAKIDDPDRAAITENPLEIPGIKF